MKTDRRRASVVCIDQNKVLMVKLRDPETKILRLFPPGGEVEKDESPDQTAYRECLEETGYKVTILEKTKLDDQYDFKWNGKVFRCLTSYYLAKLSSSESVTVDDASYNEGCCWIELSAVDEALSFDVNIRNAVRSLIENHQSYKSR
jgi:tRNA(adenine34) deaminase